jgi:hypothetical protein
MSLSFNAAAVLALFDAVKSLALGLGQFQNVAGHEPKSAPTNGLNCAIWVESIKPVASSGLASVSGEVTFGLRVYKDFLSRPEDSTDPMVLTAACGLLAAYSGAFTFGGTVRNVDVMTAGAQAGYLNQDGRMFRVMDVTLPVVINDLWTEVA